QKNKTANNTAACHARREAFLIVILRCVKSNLLCEIEPYQSWETFSPIAGQRAQFFFSSKLSTSITEDLRKGNSELLVYSIKFSKQSRSCCGETTWCRYGMSRYDSDSCRAF